MRFAICHELFRDWELERSFAFAAEIGYAGVELAPFVFGVPVAAITPRTRDSIRRAAERHGLDVVGLHWLLAETSGLHLTSPDRDVRCRTVRYLLDLAEFCSDVGGNLMVFGSPHQRNLAPGQTFDQAFANAGEVFRECLTGFERSGVTLCFEPLSPRETDFVITAADGKRLVEAVDHPAFRLHLDVKAMASEGKPIPDIIRDNAEILAHFHANDPNLRGPGMGSLDYTPIVEALLAVRYDGWVSVETFDFSLGAERNARESIDYLRKVFEQTAGQEG